jgi:hypothetical protein
MSTDGPEDQLVTITPWLWSAAVGPKDRSWLGPLLIVGVPVALAVVVFAVLLY